MMERTLIPKILSLLSDLLQESKYLFLLHNGIDKIRQVVPYRTARGREYACVFRVRVVF